MQDTRMVNLGDVKSTALFLSQNGESLVAAIMLLGTRGLCRLYPTGIQKWASNAYGLHRPAPATGISAPTSHREKTNGIIATSSPGKV